MQDTKAVAVGAMRWRAGLLLVCGLGLVASLHVFWPSAWSPDTLEQYRQAISGHFTDQHPPVMAALWRLLVLAGHPKAVIALQVGVYWLAAFLLLWNAPRRSVCAILWLAFPTSIALIGVIWKDAEVAIAWAAGWTLLLLASWQPHRRVVYSVLGGLLILFGALVRHNAFVAAPPLLLLLLTGRPVLKTVVRTVAAYAGLALATVFLSQWVNYSLLDASSPRMLQLSLPVFDMAGITAHTGSNAFPFPITKSEQVQVARCYEPQAWDSLYYYHSPCGWTMDRMGKYEKAGGSLARAELVAAAAHPIAYARHRSEYLNQFLCVVRCAIHVNRASYAPGVPDPLIAAYLWITDVFAWLFAPVNALVGCALAGWLVQQRASPERPVIVGALLASVLNLVSYIPFGVGSDQRYAYPSFVLLAFAAAALLSTRKSAREPALTLPAPAAALPALRSQSAVAAVSAG